MARTKTRKTRATREERGPGVYVVSKAAEPADDVESQQLEVDFSGLYQQDRAVEPPFDPARLLLLAEENSVHAACIDAKTVDSVGHGWTYESREKEKSHEEDAEAAADGQAVDEHLLEICPQFPFGELLDQARWEAEAVGWSAWEIARKGGKPEGDIVGIFPIPAHTLRAVPRDQKRKDRKGIWVQLIEEQTRYFVEFGSPLRIHPEHGRDVTKGEPAAREVIVFRRYSYRSPRYYGVPRWLAVLPAGAELAAIRHYNISFFESSGLVDTIIHVAADDAALADASAAKIREKLAEARGRAHTDIVTSGGPTSSVNVEPLRASNVGHREGHFGERSDGLSKEFLMVHCVPPYRIGLAVVGSLGGSSAREMLRAYRYGAIEPGQALIESRLERTLFGERGLDLKARGIRFVLKDLDWEQLELEHDAAWEGVRLGILSPNEAREKLRMSRKDEKVLDLHYFQGVPLGEPVEPPRTPPETETAPPEPGATSSERNEEKKPTEVKAPGKAERREKAADTDKKREKHVSRARPDLQRIFRASKKKWPIRSVAAGASEP